MVTRIYSETEWLACVQLLGNHKLVALPTETVYGLAGDATSETVCSSIYTVKNRAPDNPFIVHIATRDQLREIAPVANEAALTLLTEFAPGPLTVVVPNGRAVCSVATANLTSVAIRIPDHELMRKVIAHFGRPLAAPSANLSGRPSPTTAQMVLSELTGRIPAILDGGACRVGIESTVVSCLGTKVQILRAGAITLEQLQNSLGFDEVSYAPPMADILSPGQKYAHYQPKAQVVLLINDRAPQWLENLELSAKVGVLLYGQTLPPTPNHWQVCTFATLEQYAQQLYSSFYQFDRDGVKYIFASLPTELGVGKALQDRLYRAAAGAILTIKGIEYE
jgi:L-threonylcarbamoyladenylate synthase